MILALINRCLHLHLCFESKVHNMSITFFSRVLQSNLYKLKVIHLYFVFDLKLVDWRILDLLNLQFLVFIHLPYSFTYLLFDFLKFLKHLKVLFVKRRHFKNLPKWWSIGFLNTSQLFSSLYYFTNSAQIGHFLVNFLNKIERIFPFCGAQRAHLGVKWR